MKREDYSGEIFLTFVEFFFAVLLLICCGGLIYFNAHETSPEQQQLLRLEFMPVFRDLLQPELRERTTFIYLTLLSIPVCLAVIYICNALRNLKRRLETPSMLMKTTLMNIFILIIMTVCFYQPQIHPQFLYILFDPVWDHYILLLLVPALSLAAVYALFKVNLNYWCGKFIFPLLLLIPLLQILCSRLYSLDIVSHEVPDHPNVIAYALSQAATGCTDYHQYGFYHRMQAPLFRIIPPNMFNISVVMGLFFMTGCFAVYWVLFKSMKNKVLIPAFALILFFTTGTWLFLDRGRQLSIDPCFTYYPVRFIFPALSVLLFFCLIYLRKKYIAILCGIIAGLGLWWNIDSGIAAFAAFPAVMGLEFIFSKERRAVLVQSASFLGSAFLAFFALLIIFSLQQGCMISPEASLKYINLFSAAGFGMMPLPAPPAPWCVFAGIYLSGIIVGLRFFAAGRFNILAKMSIYLSVLGIGLFTYYQGRSHIWNLPTVIWPALMLMFIYTDRIIRLVKAGLVNRQFKMLVFPAVFFSVCAAATVAWDTGMIAAGVERTCRRIITPDEACPLERNVRFILANAGENKVVNIASYMQGVYYAETGLRAGIADFGMVELFFIKDWTRIVKELQQAKAPLFIARPMAGDWIYKCYKLEAVSQDGSLMYFTPLSAPAVKDNNPATNTLTAPVLR